ncbi:hypothetical protein BDF14DRAFT_1877733 [Spinellus fusiger]|nr:hypothetical protein BDF14DRAFT_1877733 [Spinellus fusiger]
MNDHYESEGNSLNRGGLNTSYLFPPLRNKAVQYNKEDSSDYDQTPDQGLLWENLDTFSIPRAPASEAYGSSKRIDTTPPYYKNNSGNNSNDYSNNDYNTSMDYNNTSSTNNTSNNDYTTSTSTNTSTNKEQGQTNTSLLAETSTSFNISWGGNDIPPTDIHPQEEPMSNVSSRPLPKPRGIRKLPEPEPGEDGLLDEDTLKRRKNASAARRSRMRRLLKIEHLEDRVNQLLTENSKLVLNNALLESEKKSMHAKESEYKKRIKYYEELTKSYGILINEPFPDTGNGSA